MHRQATACQKWRRFFPPSVVILGLLVGGRADLSAQEATGITRTVVDGGSVVVRLSQNIQLNDKSSLTRTWVTLDDPDSPLMLETVGANARFIERNYVYELNGRVTARTPIKAFRIRVLLYDAFGNHIKNLSGTEMRDMTQGFAINAHEIGQWRATESELGRYLTSVSFVEQVRTTDGRIWHYNESAIRSRLEELLLEVTEGVLGRAADPDP